VAINEVRDVARGQQATVNVVLKIYDRDGKTLICDADGVVKSKAGAGISFTSKKVTEDLMPVVAEGMPRKLFERLGK
jgi:hypothetical protein